MLRFFLFFLLLVSPLFAQTAPSYDETQLKRIENYFNSIRTLKASFLQTNNANNLLHGTLHIQKPGKLRADYGKESPLLMISDGVWMINYDKDLQQASHIPLTSHPAEVMLRDSLSFKDGFDVQKLESKQGVLKLTLTKKDAMEAGTITFVFIENPLILREWVAVDGQGNTIRVYLNDLQQNITIDASLFIAPKDTSFSGN